MAQFRTYKCRKCGYRNIFGDWYENIMFRLNCKAGIHITMHYDDDSKMD